MVLIRGMERSADVPAFQRMNHSRISGGSLVHGAGLSRGQIGKGDGNGTTNAESSYELKNMAAEAATGEWLAIVDADCIPQQSWLKVLRQAIARSPQWLQSAPGFCIRAARAWRGSCLLSRSYLGSQPPGPHGLHFRKRCLFSWRPPSAPSASS
jgi:hypothetical protein